MTGRWRSSTRDRSSNADLVAVLLLAALFGLGARINFPNLVQQAQANWIAVTGADRFAPRVLSIDEQTRKQLKRCLRDQVEQQRLEVLLERDRIMQDARRARMEALKLRCPAQVVVRSESISFREAFPVAVTVQVTQPASRGCTRTRWQELAARMEGQFSRLMTRAAAELHSL